MTTYVMANVNKAVRRQLYFTFSSSLWLYSMHFHFSWATYTTMKPIAASAWNSIALWQLNKREIDVAPSILHNTNCALQMLQY